MEKISEFLPWKPGSSPNIMDRNSEMTLPVTTGSTKKPPFKPRIKALLGNCFYRRIVIWTVVVIVLLTVTLFKPQVTTRTQDVLDLAHGSNSPSTGAPQDTPKIVQNVDLPKQESVEEVQWDETTYTGPEGDEKYADEDAEYYEDSGEFYEEQDSNGPHWLRYVHLDGYYNGLRTLVPFSDYKPEYPALSKSKPSPTVHHTKLPTPSVYNAHPDYNSDDYRQEFGQVNRCFLDEAKNVPAPDIYAYRGLPQGQPKPAIGSHSLLGMREDVCFDRFGTYGPFGLGYDVEQGGTSEALETEHEGSQFVWEKTGKINYDEVDWAVAQDHCFEANQDRFLTGNETRDVELAQTGVKKLERIAVVIRSYVGFKWTNHAVLNFRAMISELNLRSGGEYDVHFLLHVRDNDAPIWADPLTAQDILDENVPPEFHGLCTLWSTAQMKLYYPGNFGESFENPAWGPEAQDIHGVYRSAHMPLQHFANMHPEYAHFWNWEMDMRWTGSYYELFDRLGKWGARQSRQGMWERSAKYYIPALHGSWENFTELVDLERQESGKKSIMGPVSFRGKSALQEGDNFMPKSCAFGSDESQCGVGEEADLITLNPLFDTDQSGWVFAADVTGYDMQYEIPPRRCAIVTASRLSRRLLGVMHEETWRLQHSMFSEMFPPSMAFHHGLKAVYAPHPVFLDRNWPLHEIEKNFNGGPEHSTSHHGSPFDVTNEHNHKGTSWYYNSEFAGLLWRRWLGYAQKDGRGNGGGRAGEGTERGGPRVEADAASSGRLCLRSMLVHPIKWENPDEQS